MAYNTTVERLLDAIKTNTKSINVSVDTDLEINTDALETKQIATTTAVTSVNTLLTAITPVLGTATYAEATTRGIPVGAVRNDTLATLASVDNEIAPLQVNATGALYVDTTSGIEQSRGASTTNTTRIAIATDDIPIALVNTNLVALEATLTAIETDAAALEVLSTAANVDLAAIEVTQNRMVAPTSTVYLTGTKAFTGPFYAITALTETVIDVSEGNTNIVESDDSGSMQATASNLTIPAGVSLYGNFAVVELDSGTAIGYAGAGVTVAVAGS